MKNDASFNHLTTTDQEGKRIRLFPTEVKNGYWAIRRKWVQFALISFYLVLPWMQIQGRPLLLLDVVHRRFSIFGKLFFAHEVPNLVFITLSFLLFIALLTTLFGRAWCGWSCPQTIFVDRIFRKLEYWIEGDFIAQRKLHEQNLTLDKLAKKTMKWISFVIVSVILSHSFLAYFVGSKESYKLLTSSPSVNTGAFLFVIIFGGIILFDFGWLREQFCLIICPYGRMQSVMMDEGSLFLAYDEKRGDCINCMKCVRVCPTGIDVRNGLQIECIACTACADACDSVMEKIKKPKHLIGYGNILSLKGRNTHFLRGRVILYSALLITSVAGLSFRLANRSIHQTEIIRAIDTPYQITKNEDGTRSVINHFKIRFYNLDWGNTSTKFVLAPNQSPAIELIHSANINDKNPVTSGNFIDAQFFVKVPFSFFGENSSKQVFIESDWEDGEKKLTEINLVGPELGI